MSKTIANRQQLTDILRALEALPNGASIEVLKNDLGLTVSNRTLQRWLGGLISEGKITTTGQGRATLYHAKNPVEHRTETTRATSLEAPVFSQQGHALLAAMRQPLAKRKAVGYNRRFLDDYGPNETAYLLLSHTKKG